MNKQHKRDYYKEKKKIEEVKLRIEQLHDDEKVDFNLEKIEDNAQYQETKVMKYKNYDYKFGKLKFNIKNFDYETLSKINE